MRSCFVLGTRPEIIKMSPLIRLWQRRRQPFFLLHTGQHYSSTMDGVFFEQLALPKPDHNLEVGSGAHGEQTAKIISGCERVFLEERPDLVFVEGDTNSVLGAALAASKLGIPVGHVEAGLRSYDRGMPEEINRILADHASDLLFAPTTTSARILRREGVPADKVHVTGNTIVDAVAQNLGLASKAQVPRPVGEYLLLTVHRQENVDAPRRFQQVLDGVARAAKARGLDVVFPIHPRSRKMVERHGLATHGIGLVEPLGYLPFLRLQQEATIIATDSGGVQEEACILRVPCVTLRNNTERPETVEVGANRLVGTQPKAIRMGIDAGLRSPRRWRNPFGDGKASERILRISRAFRRPRAAA